MIQKKSAKKPDPSKIPGVTTGDKIPTIDRNDYTYSTMDAAEFLGLSQATVIRSAESGSIKCLAEKAGKRTRYRFRKQDLEAFLVDRFSLEGNKPEPAHEKTETEKDDPWKPTKKMQDSNPIIEEVRENHPGIFRGFGPMEWTELYSIRGHGGAMTYEGVIEFAKRLRWKRTIRKKFEAVMETHLAEPLASVIESMYKQTDV